MITAERLAPTTLTLQKQTNESIFGSCSLVSCCLLRDKENVSLLVGLTIQFVPVCILQSNVCFCFSFGSQISRDKISHGTGPEAKMGCLHDGSGPVPGLLPRQGFGMEVGSVLDLCVWQLYKPLHDFSHP